jgi:hypothetical protein
MLVYACNGAVTKRIYLDLYPAIDGAPAKLGAATHGPTQVGCGAGSEGPRTGPAAGPPAGLPVGCVDRKKPYSKVNRRRVRVGKRRVSVRGIARDRGCARLRAVLVSVRMVRGWRCRFVQANGRLGRARSCTRPVRLRARGTRSWKLQLKARLPRGHYRVQVRAVDRRGNMEPYKRRNVVRVRVR